MNPPLEMKDGRRSWTSVPVAPSSVRIHPQHGALLNPKISLILQLTSNPQNNIRYMFVEALTTVVLLRLPRDLPFPLLILLERVKLCLSAKSRKRSDWMAGNLCAS